MSGRGRGRRGAEGGTINRGEPFLSSVQQPSPLFPVMEHKPLPLTCGEEAEYLLALKQEFRGAMMTRPGFIQPHTGHRSHADVERYSDKYHNSNEQTDALTDWIKGVIYASNIWAKQVKALPPGSDWKRFPKEIRLCVRRPLKKGASKAVLGSKRDQADEQKENVEDKKQVLLKLETLANEEQRSSEDEDEEEKKKEGDQEVDDEYDEEELEEETDYIMSYFDNGEDFGAESDDNMDEAVY